MSKSSHSSKESKRKKNSKTLKFFFFVVGIIITVIPVIVKVFGIGILEPYTTILLIVGLIIAFVGFLLDNRYEIQDLKKTINDYKILVLR